MFTFFLKFFHNFDQLTGPILSVIILVINKSDSHFQLSDFVNRLYDYRLSWTPLSGLITIINNQRIPSRHFLY